MKNRQGYSIGSRSTPSATSFRPLDDAVEVAAFHGGQDALDEYVRRYASQDFGFVPLPGQPARLLLPAATLRAFGA